MRIEVAILPQLISHTCNSEEPVVGLVIDTLRFTTTACEALRSAASIRVASEVDEAQKLQAELARCGRPPLLCGERKCQPISGFDLGNSPFEYTPEIIADRELIFTTTNGTRAVQALRNAQEIWLAALTNRRAVVTNLLEKSPAHVELVCSGTEGEVTLEDCLAAGAVVHALVAARADSELNDSAQICARLWSQCESLDCQELEQVLANTLGGRNLRKAGYERDLGFAAQLDSSLIVPRSESGEFNLFQADGKESS